MIQPLYQVPNNIQVRGLRFRPDAVDEELLQNLPKKGVLEEPAAHSHGWWGAVLAAVSQFGGAVGAVGARGECFVLPSSLAPLRCFEGLEISRLSRLLHVDHLADIGHKIVSLPEFLRLLGCPDATRLARQELQEIAQEALKTGTFEGKVLQLHHLAVLQWAGVRCTLPGQSAMHCLCLGASGRTWMGGGKSVAPLRGAAWGARARYLMQRKEWVLNTSNALNHAQTDAQGCTGLNYLLAPLKPSSDCVGTVNYEIVQSLLSWTAKTYQTTEMQVEAGRALLNLSNGFYLTVTAVNLPKPPSSLPSALPSTQESPPSQTLPSFPLSGLHGFSMVATTSTAPTLPQADQEDCDGDGLQADFFDFLFSEQQVMSPALTIFEPLGCALTECRLNLFQARAMIRRALAPQAQLRLLNTCARRLEGDGEPCNSAMSAAARTRSVKEVLVQKKHAWETRREEFERRIARLELELQNAAALPPVVSTVNQPVEGKETGKTQVLGTVGDFGDFPGRKEAKALIKKLRAQRILEAAPAELEKSVERAKVSLSAAVDRLAQDLYGLEGHFVFELVQNADDNCYQVDEPELCLSLHQTGAEQFFMSWNNERGLTERDVLALCDVNASAKRSGCIGKKGIGWKSTFAVSNCPHVLSGCFTFKFDVDSLGKLGYVTPTWLSDKELKRLPIPVQDAHRQGGTLIYLPLFSGVSGIVEAFDNLLQNHATLLFLKRLCRISFGYPDGKQIRIQRVLGEEDHFIYMTEQGEPGEQSSEQNVSLTALHPKDSNDSTGSNSNGTCDGNAFQCFRYAMHHFRVPEGDVKAALGQPDEITLRLAFPLDRGEDLSVMAVHVGLPVRAVGFCFAIDGPFDLVASRRDLHEGSAVNRLICDAIPDAFREFMATAPRMGSMAMKLVGADVVPRPLWLHVRQKLLESLAQVACVLTECGEVCAPSSCIERPKHPLALRASELIPPKLLKISCGRSFASSSLGSGYSGSGSSSSGSSLETLSLAHWVKVLSYRGGDWPKGLIAEVTSWENPCDFFLPFCRWLEMELKEAEQPSEVLNQIWDLDLLPAFRSELQPLRLSSGHIFARPCVKIRTEWQGALCDAEVLRIVEPRCRCALQSATPFLLESLTWPSPTRAELAAACIRSHQMDFDPFAVAEPMSMKAVLASLACLKEAFLADEVLEPEVTWKELGKRLWIPSTKRVLQRPSQLSNYSFLGVVVGSAEGTVSLEIQSTGGDRSDRSDRQRDILDLGWEAFLDAIGVTPLSLSDVSDDLSLSVALGQRLCSRQWWGDVEKMGAVMSYVQKRCQTGEFGPMGALPVAVRRNERAQRKICLRDHFLYEVYHRLGGQYLHYIRLPEGSNVSVQECLNQLGVQVHLTIDGLVKALKMLRANQCANIEVFADVYKEISEIFKISESIGSIGREQEMLRGLVFVAGGIRTLEECTWEEEPNIQWLTQVPSLKVSYHRYGPPLQRYFLEVLQMPEVHPGFRPSCLITALKNLVEHVEKAMSRNRQESLPGTPTTAGQLLDSMKDLAAQIYGALAQACRKSSMTWHADVRRAFVQERLLLLPGQDSPSNSSNPSNPNSSNSRTSSSQRAKRPKRLFAKEAWWDVEDELAESKAANLSLRPLYEGVLGVPDAEFLFLRVLGLRKRCSRADIAHRLKASMNCPGPLSNWAEGIDITDLEELEDIQTSSYFRPPDWRVPERQTQESQETDSRVNEARRVAAAAAFQPPPAASPHPPAWRSTASAADAARRAEAALEAQRDQRATSTAEGNKRRTNLTTQRCQNHAERRDVADAPVQQMQQAQQVQRMQRMQSVQSVQSVPEHNEQRAEQRTEMAEKFQNSSAPNSSPSARTPRHRFAWREPHQEHAERPQKVTWAQLRAQQEQKRHVSVLRESLQSPNVQPTRASRASAWASFVGAQATERGIEGIQPDQTDAEALLVRLEALQQTTRQRRGQVEALCSERKQVEDTTERYVRILQDFYDNM